MPTNRDRPVGVALLSVLFFISAAVCLAISAAMTKGVLLAENAPEWLIGALAKRAPYLALFALFPATLGFGL